MNENQHLQDQIDQLRREVVNLTDSFYRNNFPSSQDFSKYSRFNTRLKVPHYSAAPSTCDVGEIIEVDGKLRICSAADVWTVVGTQT